MMRFGKARNCWIVAAWVGTALVGGCSKEPSNPAAAAPKTREVQDPVAAVARRAVDDVPADYVTLQSGRQLVGLYWASAKRNVDYSDVAGALYQKYAAERNELLRDGMLKDLKPEIDAEIERTRNVKYLVLEPDAPSAWIGNYDAEYKNFPVTTMAGGSAKYSFSDVGGYALSFNNPRAFSRLNVADPALVEKIEKLKRNFAMSVRVYVRITGAQPGNNVLEADIQKVEVLDNNENVLAVIKT